MGISKRFICIRKPDIRVRGNAVRFILEMQRLGKSITGTIFKILLHFTLLAKAAKS